MPRTPQEEVDALISADKRGPVRTTPMTDAEFEIEVAKRLAATVRTRAELLATLAKIDTEIEVLLHKLQTPMFQVPIPVEGQSDPSVE